MVPVHALTIFYFSFSGKWYSVRYVKREMKLREKEIMPRVKKVRYGTKLMNLEFNSTLSIVILTTM